ncbi:MAG: hypothetical protein EOP35_21165, partial [Rubrivivax sp.]
MTTFRLATLAAATALTFALPARAEVVNAPTVMGTVGGTAVLTVSFNVDAGFDVEALQLLADWPAFPLVLDPVQSTVLGAPWPTFVGLFD